MNDSTWLRELRQWIDRHTAAAGVDPAEQIALSSQELLGGVPDTELLNADGQTDGAGLLAEALLSAVEQREIDP